MNRIELLSPAKINLYLKVLGKRPDGFHEIKTVFERIDLCDKISFTKNKTGKIKIHCSHPHVPVGPKNLVYQVARMLKEKCQISQGVDVTIEKKIPVAAGLAGGSSNAATALLGLNKLWDIGLTKRQLCYIAAKLGSDISFFLHDASFALGTGRGEKIRKLNISTKLWHILVVPRIKVYSKDVYSRVKLSLTKKDDNATILIHNLRNSNVLGLRGYLTNDLENAIFRLEPRLLVLKERLKSLSSDGVMLSGSGPSTFGLVESKDEASSLKYVLGKRFSQVYAVRTL